MKTKKTKQKLFKLPKLIRKPFQVLKDEIWIGTRKELLNHFKSLKSDNTPREIPGLSVKNQLEKGYKAGGGLYRIFFITERIVPSGIDVWFVGQIVDIQPIKQAALK